MHTKAPWFYENWDMTYVNRHKHFFIPIGNKIPDEEYEGTGVAVCLLPHENDTPKNRKMMEANARLIAAAPELLEVLKEIYDDVEQGAIPNSGDEWFKKAKSVIQKAEA